MQTEFTHAVLVHLQAMRPCGSRITVSNALERRCAGLLEQVGEF